MDAEIYSFGALTTGTDGVTHIVSPSVSIDGVSGVVPAGTHWTVTGVDSVSVGGRDATDSRSLILVSPSASTIKPLSSDSDLAAAGFTLGLTFVAFFLLMSLVRGVGGAPGDLG